MHCTMYIYVNNSCEYLNWIFNGRSLAWSLLVGLIFHAMKTSSQLLPLLASQSPLLFLRSLFCTYCTFPLSFLNLFHTFSLSFSLSSLSLSLLSHSFSFSLSSHFNYLSIVVICYLSMLVYIFIMCPDGYYYSVFSWDHVDLDQLKKDLFHNFEIFLYSKHILMTTT